MANVIWGIAILGLLVLAVGVASWRPFVSAWREARFAEARRDFHYQREHLEAKFVSLGHAVAGGPHWTDCEFDDDVAYARNRKSGQLSALVAVAVKMDESDETSCSFNGFSPDLRDATALFQFNGGRWDTDGRAIFNLTPAQAISFYQPDLEMVARELAGRSGD